MVNNSQDDLVENGGRGPTDRQGEYVLDGQMGHLLRRAHQRATAILTGSMTEFQLTPTQFAALVKIMEKGAVSQNELGRPTAMDPATIQGVVRRLSRRGLVQRNRDARDRRRTMLAMTETGERLAAAAIKVGPLAAKEILAPLPAREQQILIGLLRKLT